MKEVIEKLTDLAERLAAVPLLSRTHGAPAHRPSRACTRARSPAVCSSMPSTESTMFSCYGVERRWPLKSLSPLSASPFAARPQGRQRRRQRWARRWQTRCTGCTGNGSRRALHAPHSPLLIALRAASARGECKHSAVDVCTVPRYHLCAASEEQAARSDPQCGIRLSSLVAPGGASPARRR